MFAPWSELSECSPGKRHFLGVRLPSDEKSRPFRWRCLSSPRSPHSDGGVCHRPAALAPAVLATACRQDVSTWHKTTQYIAEGFPVSHSSLLSGLPPRPTQGGHWLPLFLCQPLSKASVFIK